VGNAVPSVVMFASVFYIGGGGGGDGVLKTSIKKNFDAYKKKIR
jgi:hypothetical protein